MSGSYLIKTLKIHPINIIVFGPPGVGKGSYCKLLSRDLNLKSLSSGELFRKTISQPL